MTDSSGDGASQTFVTCLFDLARREWTGRRDTSFYLRHGAYVLGLDAPLVVFSDPELAAGIREKRASRGWSDRTVVIDEPLEARLGAVGWPAVESVPTFDNANPAKDTALYQALMWTKVDMVGAVIARNPFQTDYFAWIDFGVRHVAAAPATPPGPSARLALLEMRSVPPQSIVDRRAFYSAERGYVAGGFLRGDRATWAELDLAFRAELGAALAAGRRPNEQQILSYLTASRGELFAPYFGDYASVLTNWDYVRRDLSAVLANVRHCWAHGLNARARLIGEALLATIKAGVRPV